MHLLCTRLFRALSTSLHPSICIPLAHPLHTQIHNLLQPTNVTICSLRMAPPALPACLTSTATLIPKLSNRYDSRRNIELPLSDLACSYQIYRSRSSKWTMMKRSASSPDQSCTTSSLKLNRPSKRWTRICKSDTRVSSVLAKMLSRRRMTHTKLHHHQSHNPLTPHRQRKT